MHYYVQIYECATFLSWTCLEDVSLRPTFQQADSLCVAKPLRTFTHLDSIHGADADAGKSRPKLN